MLKKLKRAFHSASSHVLPSLTGKHDFRIRQALVCGIAATPTAIAYDPIQRLLAIATFSGELIVFGDTSIQAYFSLVPATTTTTTTPSTSRKIPVKWMHFKQGDGLLLTIDARQTLTGWNLVTQAIDYQLTISPDQYSITCMTVPMGIKWIFMGTAQGSVLILDGDRGILSTAIPSPSNSHTEDGWYVSSVEIHPQHPNQVLIGYANSTMVLWDLFTQSPLRTFHFNNPSSSLTSLAWKPDGTHFLASYDDGQLVLWNTALDTKPSAQYWPVKASIRNLVWMMDLDNGDASSHTILVCTDSTTEVGGSGVHLFKLNAKDWTTPTSLTHLPLPSSPTSTTENAEYVSSATVLADSPWCTGNTALDPLALFCITSSGRLLAFDTTLTPNTAWTELPLFDILNLWNAACGSPGSADGSAVMAGLVGWYMVTSAEWSEMHYLSCLNFDMDVSLRADQKHEQIANVLPMVCGGMRGSQLRRIGKRGQSVDEGGHREDGMTALPEIDPTMDTEETGGVDEAVLRDVLITATPVHSTSTKHEDMHTSVLIRFWDAASSLTLKELKSLTFEISAAQLNGPSMGTIIGVRPMGDEALLVVTQVGVVLAYRYVSDEDDLKKIRVDNVAVDGGSGSVGFQMVNDGSSRDMEEGGVVRLGYRLWYTFTPATVPANVSCFDLRYPFLAMCDQSGNVTVLDVKAMKMIWTGHVGMDNARPSALHVTMEHEEELVVVVGGSGGELTRLGLKLIQSTQDEASLEWICQVTSVPGLTNESVVEILSVLVNGTCPTVQQVIPSQVDTTKSPRPSSAKKKRPKDDSAESLNQSGLLYILVGKQSVTLRAGNLASPTLFTYQVAPAQQPSSGEVIKAGIVVRKGSAQLVVVDEDATVFILTLPKLEVAAMQSFSVPTKLTSKNVQIFKDGRVQLQVPETQFRQIYIFSDQNPHNLPNSKPTLHDSNIEIPDRPSPKTEGDSNWLGTVKRVLATNRWTTTSDWKSMATRLDAQYSTTQPAAVATSPTSPTTTTTRKKGKMKKMDQGGDNEESKREELGLSSAEANVRAAASSQQNAFGNAAQGLAERGEKLEQLDGKFANLASQSEDFLKSIREYNRKQEQKKWYQW